MSKGNVPKERAKLLVKALLEYQERQGEETIRELVVTWLRKSNQHLEVTEDSPILEIKATKESLFHLINNYIPSLGLRGDYADKEFEKKKRGLKKVIGEVIVDGLDRHLGILTCDRKQEREQKAVGKWIFTLRL